MKNAISNGMDDSLYAAQDAIRNEWKCEMTKMCKTTKSNFMTQQQEKSHRKNTRKMKTKSLFAFFVIRFSYLFGRLPHWIVVHIKVKNYRDIIQPSPNDVMNLIRQLWWLHIVEQIFSLLSLALTIFVVDNHAIKWPNRMKKNQLNKWAFVDAPRTMRCDMTNGRLRRASLSHDLGTSRTRQFMANVKKELISHM